MKPPRVKDEQTFWIDPPPERSARCAWWVEQFAAGWKPNRRIRGEGYHGSACFYGVYIWEYLNVIYPLEAALE